MSRFDFLETNSFDIIGPKPKSIASELLILTQQNAYCQENICDVILFLVKASPKAFILLDGLDEGLSDSGWERTGVKDVLDFVILLASECPDKVRVWCSSQYRPYFNETLVGFTTVNITDNPRQDVTRFLQAVMGPRRCAEAISNEIPKELICDYWSFDSSEPPVLRPRYTIHLTDNHDWKIYNNPPDDQKLSKEMAPCEAFSNDSQTLRIGTQLYARRGENSFDAIQGEKATGTKDTQHT
ncbi:hypothetical protein PLEOSDRAFT_1102580 [Pleurotus ostreatus PC15]|uniref:NACHT domain-containing protein n=1 Tax=Pleurotus ostreatus (strain PC15) TaxID=1137138 RepID=A0A067NKS4_PLEO1|nr:hypothetical protein PLEOSDRAFT_1102580 [Pleurotus ostreatus PC15]